MGTARAGWRAGALGLGLALALAACASSAAPERTVVVGAGSTEEQSVLGALAVAALDRAGFDTELPEDEDRATLSWASSALSAGEGVLCADGDFVHRAGGLDALADAYAINRDQLEVRVRAEEEAIEEVATGECFAGLATATSGTARNAGLEPLSDDLVVFPAFVVVPVAREGAVERLAGLDDALDPVVDSLDTATLASLNAEVVAGADPAEVAERVLAEMVADEE